MRLRVEDGGRRRLTLERLLAPGWPPITALCLAAAVFVGILLATPPGLLAPVMVFIMPAHAPGALSAAYAAGAAASLALLTLVILAPVLAVLDVLAERLQPMGPAQRTSNSGPTSGQESV